MKAPNTNDLTFDQMRKIISESTWICTCDDGWRSLYKHPDFGYLKNDTDTREGDVHIFFISDEEAKDIIPLKTAILWLDKYCYIKPSDIAHDEGLVYYTKVGNYYVTRSGMENYAQNYADLDIEPIDIHDKHQGKVFCVGKSNTDGKYYGWSHRAMYGFAVGSRIKPDSPAYKPSNLGELIKITNDFWYEPEYQYTNSCIAPFNYHPDYNEEFKVQLSKDGFRTDYMIMTTWLYNDKVSNEKIRNTISGTFTFVPQKFIGSRKYAKTQRHALQMAIDFAEGVS